MSWSFTDTLTFIAVMAVRDNYRQESDRIFKTKQFYQQCYQEMVTEGENVFEQVVALSQKATGGYVVSELTEGSIYFSLYAFGLVLRTQKNITAEQRKLLNCYFSSFKVPFTQTQYEQAMTRMGSLQQYDALMRLNAQGAGQYWVQLFRVLRQAGSAEDFQKIVDAVCRIAMRFAVLGNKKSDYAMPACMQFIEVINQQIAKEHALSTTEVDWFGVVPLQERLAEMRRFFQQIVRRSGISPNGDISEYTDLFELALLSCVCDITMLTNNTNDAKLRMIEAVVKEIGIQASVTPRQFILEKAHKTELGRFYKSMLTFSKTTLGDFWDLLRVMGEKTNMQNEATVIINGVLSVLLFTEKYYVTNFHLKPGLKLAKEYSETLLYSLANTK